MNLRLVSELHQHHHHDNDEEDVSEEVHQPRIIFDAENPGDKVPNGFQAVMVSIDGTIKSNLDWSAASSVAQSYVAQGLKIFWNIDLGLFSHLALPISDPGQFQSLLLSLEHFRDTLWDQFRQHTVGLCMYRGPADFSHVIPQDVACEYLNLLAQRLPDTIQKYLLLDANHVEDPLHRAQLLNKERFFHFTLAVDGARGCGGDCGWNQEFLSMGFIGKSIPKQVYQAPSCAICLPPMSSMDEQAAESLRQLFADIQNQGITYRVIPECYLTVSWDGLDTIFVSEKHVTPQGKRMLNGFRAAGGVVVNK